MVGVVVVAGAERQEVEGRPGKFVAGVAFLGFYDADHLPREHRHHVHMFSQEMARNHCWKDISKQIF